MGEKNPYLLNSFPLFHPSSDWLPFTNRTFEQQVRGTGVHEMTKSLSSENHLKQNISECGTLKIMARYAHNAWLFKLYERLILTASQSKLCKECN